MDAGGRWMMMNDDGHILYSRIHGGGRLAIFGAGA